MRVGWVLVVIMVAFVAASSTPASACVGPVYAEFEAQAVSCGTAFPDMSLLSATLVDELFPQTIVFQDQLYVVWQKENFTDSVKYFLTLRSFDGTSWTDPIYPSCVDMDNPTRSELNLNPRMGADDQALYLAWTSTEPNWTTGVDDDVVFRFTEDGETWSEVIEISGHYNNGLDKLPMVQPFGDQTWFLWETNDRLDSDGGDMDIVMRPWDGTDFGQTIEVTPPGDAYNDHHVQVASDGDLMYIMWMKANYTSGLANVHDVWARVFDGTAWVTPPMKLNSDALADNEHPTVTSTDGRAFFIWETRDTGKLSDPSSIVMREWTPDEGLGTRITVSSMSSNGKDTKPTGLWYHDRLFISWISADQGVTFGNDADLVYRVAQEDRFGQLRFDDFVEVSPSTDDYGDRFPNLVVYDDIVNVVWVVDSNYTEELREINATLLNEIGGYFRSPDVCIQSIYIPFEKQLGLVYTLGMASPLATIPTSAKVTVTDLRDEPLEGMDVALLIEPRDGAHWRVRNIDLRDKGSGKYANLDVTFPAVGDYDVTILVQGIEAGAFTVEVVPPPPSYVDRVPMTAIFFIAAGIVLGLVLFRMMGREELVDEIRPAPLGAVPEEFY
jgi:hypothetical protein